MSGDSDDASELTNPELPGGGARVVKVREQPREKPLKPPPVSALSVAVPRGTGRPEPAESRWKVAPDPEADDDIAAAVADAAATDAAPEPSGAEDERPPLNKPLVAHRDDAIVPLDIESDAEPAPAIKRGGALAAAAQREPEPEIKPPPQSAAEPDELLELIVLNVMAPAGEKFRGREMLEILLACDLRLGSMNIFHRYEQAGGKGREQFSVINSVEPGVFDLDNIDEFETPGVGFFMRLPGPEDPMEAFECMLETARCLVKNLDGQLLDDRHSAATGQTVEHYRQRIRDFERKQLTLV